jgi:hypothetical protein
MTTIIHNVSRVTSTGSSVELAESHVNKTTRLATEDSESPGGDSEGATQAPSRHPPSIHLRHRLPVISDNTGVC